MNIEGIPGTSIDYNTMIIIKFNIRHMNWLEHNEY